MRTQINPCFDYIDKVRCSRTSANQARRPRRQRAPSVNSSCRSTPEYSHAAVSQKLSQQYSRQRRVRPATSSGAQRILPPLRAPSQFPASPCRDFRAHQLLITESRRVTQPQPDEVRHLVNENPRKLRARAIESDPPFAQKRARMHRAAAVPQPAHRSDPHRRPAAAPASAQNARCAVVRSRILRQKKRGRRHSLQSTAAPRFVGRPQSANASAAERLLRHQKFNRSDN